MAPKLEHLEAERANYEFFLEPARGAPAAGQRSTALRGSQLRQPLFEYSGACSGCGETPYLKLLSQLYGDHLVVANATGCSSIYGGNLPTTPWSQNARRPGPGLGQQPVRGQRRVRPRHAAGARRAARPGADAGARAARARSARRWPPRCSKRRRTPTRRSARSASASKQLKAILARRSRSPQAAAAAGGGRQPGRAQRLDRRRRRLGLRHRLRRPRPRARLGPQRQHPGARHRGLQQHRRPGVEVHAARRGGQVRRRRQGDRQEGPRHDRHGLRQRLRGAGRDGRQPGADGAHLPGGGLVDRARR